MCTFLAILVLVDVGRVVLPRTAERADTAALLTVFVAVVVLDDVLF